MNKENIVLRLNDKEKIIGPVSKLNVKVVNNSENGFAAALVGAICEAKAETIMNSLSRFQGI